MSTDEIVENPTDYTRAEQRHYEQIREQERVVATLAITSEDTKRTANAAKKAFEAGDEKLRELIHAGPDPQPKLPGMEDVDDKCNDEWRTLPIEDLEIIAITAKRLRDEDIATIGDLSGFISDHGGEWWRYLSGIGAVQAEGIANCYVEFWTAHPEYCEPTEDE